jgi:signal transduction histidine kinase
MARVSGLLRSWWLASIAGSSQTRELSDGSLTSLTSVLGALRWGAVVIGLAWAASQAANGEIPVVLTLAITIFITVWRTVSPIKMGEAGWFPLVKALGDVAVLSLAIGISGNNGVNDGLSSPFLGSLLVAIATVGFGWGVAAGVLATVVAVMVSPVVSAVNPNQALVYPGPVAVTALAAAALLPGIAVDRLAEIERRRRAVAAQRDTLAEANKLLGMLSDLARTLPSSLDLNDVLQATRHQLAEKFEPDRIAIIAYEGDEWTPQFLSGFDLPPRVATDQLPSPLDRAAESTELVRVVDLSTVSDRAGSGLYTRLVVNNTDIGLLGVEHTVVGRYDQSDAEVLHSMSDVLALTLANARTFRRLRSLAAAEERSRIARDLHDRLGQYLTYIALELERINSSREVPSPELKELHGDVQGAISEFRDTLIELRTAVTPDRPLALVLTEVVERFRRRSGLDASLTVAPSEERLPALVENELLRITQEALANVTKHAEATEVHLAWTVDGGRGVLVVQDDGRGFDPAKGIRGTAYGLVGMRERAASVGAHLEISSEPGQGTTITVQTSQLSEQVNQQ